MKNHFLRSIYLILIFILSLSATAQTQLRLPAILSDHMLLQQNADVKIWGWAMPQTVIQIIPQWNNDTITIRANEKAKWETKIKTPSAGGPYKMIVKSKDRSIEIKDIMIGELWLCSGQSNMDWNFSRGIKDPKETYPQQTDNNIRFFRVDRTTSEYPQDDIFGKWVVCDPETFKTFSAVGYYFGKKLNSTLNVPIGLIHSAWGGTNAETWTPKEYIKEDSDLYNSWKRHKYNKGRDISIATTYNAMIAPITNLNIAGTIWYQGENNIANAETYDELMRTMIKAWRDKFGKNFPFYYVMIAPHSGYKETNIAALVREQQVKTMSLENAGMVIVSDLVEDVTDIHPRFKKPVGERLANWALAETYHKKAPKYRHATFKNASIEKNKIYISFNDTQEGLTIKGKEIVALEIAGSDGIFYPAIGKIDKKTNQLVAESKHVKTPVYVRYSFSNDGIGNLFDMSGLPVSPFRSDNLPIRK